MKTVFWQNGKVKLIDQTKLPLEEVFLSYQRWQDIARAIKTMKVRGAPAIGVTAALGVALAASKSKAKTTKALLAEVDRVSNSLARTRPTAINLFWALERMSNKAHASPNLKTQELKKILLQEALLIAKEDEEACRKMGKFGASLIKAGDNILTHCNAGGLATVSYGTALGVIRAAHEQGKKIHVYVDETRPLLQGSRLTAWELKKARIPFTLICDNMAGYLMKLGKINKVVVGADRIASNGDAANKIGTYTAAILASANKIPFYVAAPCSTIDPSLKTGKDIPIEQRAANEVTEIKKKRIAPLGIDVFNPAFDVTEAKYISAIITEKGIARPPYATNLKKFFK